MKVRKKPVVVDAWQFDGTKESADEIRAAVGEEAAKALMFDGGWLHVVTLEGGTIATPMHWVIRGVNGELYPCAPHIFEKTYEPAE